MTDRDIVGLQKSVNLLKLEPGSDTKTCHDGNQVLDIKVEGVADMQAEDGPVVTSCPVIKTEEEVSQMFICTL